MKISLGNSPDLKKDRPLLESILKPLPLFIETPSPPAYRNARISCGK